MAYGDFETKVGETVGVVRRSRYGLVSSQFGTVTKINGYGHIFVQAGEREFRFTRRGAAYKAEYGPSLCNADMLRKEIERETLRKDRASIAREIEQELKSGWSYSGTFHASAERIDTLKTLLGNLEKLVDTV
jgi:hypothetical protein